MMSEQNQVPVMHVWLYAPDNGAKVGFDVPMYVDYDKNLGALANKIIAALLANGYTVNAAGTEPGEEVVTIEWISCLSATDRDGIAVPRIGFYPEASRNYNFVMVQKYLNTEAEQREFEQATGLIIENLPIPETETFPERGKVAALAKYIVHLPKPIQIAHKPNPQFVEGGKKPKRLFARYLGVTGMNTPNSSTNVPEPPLEGKNSHSSGAPTWWSIVMAEKQLRALFNADEHFANKVKKMLRDGLLTNDMDARRVIEEIKSTVAFDKINVPAEGDEIPF